MNARNLLRAATALVLTRRSATPNLLVPTAEGVREPQNRRVEIVLK